MNLRQTRISNLYLTLFKREPDMTELKKYSEEEGKNIRVIKSELLNSLEMHEKLNQMKDQFEGVKITILTLFRNNVDYLPKFKSQLKKLEQIYGKIKFSYYFYENDSIDNTPEQLEKFLIGRNGKVLSEKLNIPMEYGISVKRVKNMAMYRNKLLELANPLSKISDWTIIMDTNIFIEDYSILGIMLNFAQMHKDAIMIAANGLAKNTRNPYHSYDTFAFRYQGKQSIFCFSKDCFHCPSALGIYDFKTEYLEVDAVFGGFTMVRSDLLEKVRYKESYENAECEHVHFCTELKKLADKNSKIYLLPHCIVSWKN